jgi:hypothetical protein
VLILALALNFDGILMRHEDIWRAIDTLAAERGLSASGLARRAGLNATTFNQSKRSTPDGRARWPSTESVSKVLGAADATLEEFASLVSGARALPAGGRPTTRRLPMIAMSQTALPGYFDESGYPSGKDWDEAGLPEVSDPHAFAIEVSGARTRLSRWGYSDRLAAGAGPARGPSRSEGPQRPGHGASGCSPIASRRRCPVA